MHQTTNFEKNFEQSPFTGWTRESWEDLAEKMIIAIQPYLTEGKGGLDIPNPVKWMDKYLQDPENMKSFYWMEGYTRTRVLLASYMVGTGKTTIQYEGKTINLVEQFIQGLLSASNPSSPDFIGDRYENNQWIAEISGLAGSIYLLKDLVWQKLSENEKEQVAKWMLSTTGRKIPNNNWYLFIANTHLVLKALGREYNQEELDFCIQKIKEFDLGNGWFTDGDESRGHSIEQYNAWGFNYFLPLFALTKGLPQEDNEWIVDRLKKFILSYQNFFAANGAIPMWGRSWAYRPALTIPFILGELLDESPISHGLSRRIVSGQMKFYIENGFLDENMLPTMGYLGENFDLIDPYSQYGSPYWGNLIFMNLLIPKSHSFWTDKEQPLPVEENDYTIGDSLIGMNIFGNKKTGEVQIINHRAWHQKESAATKYAKKYTAFSYSSHFGIDLTRTENGYNPDNMLSISLDGEKYSHRIIPIFESIEDNYGISSHYPLAGFPFVEEEDSKTFSADKTINIVEDRSVKITTHILIKSGYQIRLNILDTEKEIYNVREGSYAFNFLESSPTVFIGNKKIAVHNNGAGSFIQGLLGFNLSNSIAKTLESVDANNTNGGKSLTPILESGNLKPGRHVFLSLSGTFFNGSEELVNISRLIKNVIANENSVILEFNDNTEFTFNLK